MNSDEEVGILILKQTYGRDAKSKRLLYRCVPFHREHPPLLLPYTMKYKFSKHQLLFCVAFSRSAQQLTQVFGPVDNPSTYHDYILRAFQLSAPSCRLIPQPFLPTTLPTLSYPFVTIDSAGTRIFDDAYFTDGQHTWIAIANPLPFLQDDHWKWMRKHARPKTFHSPQGGRHSFLPSLIEERASLLAQRPAPCLVWHFTSEQDTQPTVLHACITVHANVTDDDYPSGLIETWMNRVNQAAAHQLSNLSSPIVTPVYRGSVTNHIEYSTVPIQHEGLDTEVYCHCTSPLRRAADLINCIALSAATATVSPWMMAWVEQWTASTSTLEEQCKRCEKAERMLYLHHWAETNTMVRGMMIRSDETHHWTRVQVGAEIFVVIRVSNDDIPIQECHYQEAQQYKAHYFPHEDQVHKKVRLTWLHNHR